MEAANFEQFKEEPVDKKLEEALSRVAEENRQEEKITEGRLPAQVSVSPQQAVESPDRDEELLMIENILSENIAALYRQLSAEKQQAFRKRGEEVALKIKGTLRQTRVRAHELLQLIKEWLKMLPGISYYFLEQEAKIKTDKVLQMKREGQEIER